MKRLLLTIFLGKYVLFHKVISIPAEKVSCKVIKGILKQVIFSIRISKKDVVVLIKHCLFKLIRIIVETRVYRQWETGTTTTAEYNGVKIKAKFLDDGSDLK